MKHTKDSIKNTSGLKMKPKDLMLYPEIPLKIKVEKITIPEQQHEGLFMNTDKVTTIAGSIAVVCGGILSAGVLVPSTAIYIAVVTIGTISGGIFAWFTNKPNPFEKPK